MKLKNGYAGNILRIDLSTGKIGKVPTENYSEKYLGGRGIAAKIYWDEVPGKISPFDPENHLIFITGPVTSTTGFCGSRWQICGKSPLHNMFSYCNLGGNWGAHLKMAGYDGLVVHGAASGPSYIYISNENIEIRSGIHLAGMGAISAREKLIEETGKPVKVVAVGPAGENRVRFANFIGDKDSSGSSGLAAVMGSKNLKAIAVIGKEKVEPFDKDKLKKIRKRALYLMSGLDDEYVDTVAPHQKMIPSGRLKKDVCYSCTGHKCIRKKYTAKDGKNGKFACGSSFYYNVRANRYYGEINDVPFYATKLCDDYGLDTHVLEPIIMWLNRCFKAGILTDERAGIPLSKIGSLEYIESLIKKISFREGFGDLLAEGPTRAAAQIGREAQSLITEYINRNEQSPFYGARMYLTTGLIYATEPRLPMQLLHEISTLAMRWTINEVQKPEEEGVTTSAFRAIGRRFWGNELAADFSTYDGKALAAVRIQDRQYAKESLILCDFNWPVIYSEHTEDNVGDPELESRICSAVTGREIDEEELYIIGERVFNLQRAILIREGWKGREQDTLDDFDFNTPLKGDFGNPESLIPGENGKTMSRKGTVVERDKFEKMKDEFYELRGWDIKTGLQTKTCLEKLGLDDVADNLEKKGLVAS